MVVEVLDHEVLVSELRDLEQLSPQDRLAHAKERRAKQIQNYEERKKHEDTLRPSKASHNKSIKFEENVALIEASARNDAEEVEEMIEAGIRPDLQNEDGLSALHQAVIEDCVDVVEVLVEHGANLNIKDADGWTPLHAAVACGNYDLVIYLVANGASMVEINTDGNMPIDLVENNEEIEVFLDRKMEEHGYTEDSLDELRNRTAREMLVDLKESVARGRSLDVTGEHGETAMHIAAANGYLEVVEFLLENGARVDAIDNDFWQPIHAAACWGQDKVIELLVKHGSDLDAETADGETPYDLTEDEELQEMLKELKESGRRSRELKRSQSNSSRTLSVRRSSIVDKHRTSVSDARQEGMFRQNKDILQVVINPDEKELVINGAGKDADSSSPPVSSPKSPTQKYAAGNSPVKASTVDALPGRNIGVAEEKHIEKVPKGSAGFVAPTSASDSEKKVSSTVNIKLTNQSNLKVSGPSAKVPPGGKDQMATDQNHRKSDARVDVVVDVDEPVRYQSGEERIMIDGVKPASSSTRGPSPLPKGAAPRAEKDSDTAAAPARLGDVKLTVNHRDVDVESGDAKRGINTADEKKNKELTDSTEIHNKKKCCVIV